LASRKSKKERNQDALSRVRGAGSRPIIFSISTKVLTDEEIRDINAYLSSVPGGNLNDVNRLLGR
jgi:hypothetical protein